MGIWEREAFSVEAGHEQPSAEFRWSEAPTSGLGKDKLVDIHLAPHVEGYGVGGLAAASDIPVHSEAPFC
jgi:hypothetical protein